KGPIPGGSLTAAIVGPAVKAACDAVHKRLFGLGRDLPDSPLAQAKLDDVRFADGRIMLASDPSLSVSIIESMRYGGVAKIEEEAQFSPDENEEKRYAMYIHSA